MKRTNKIFGYAVFVNSGSQTVNTFTADESQPVSHHEPKPSQLRFRDTVSQLRVPKLSTFVLNFMLLRRVAKKLKICDSATNATKWYFGE